MSPRKENSEVSLVYSAIRVQLSIIIPTMVVDPASSLGDRRDVACGATAERFGVAAETEGYFVLTADFSNRSLTSPNEQRRAREESVSLGSPRYQTKARTHRSK